MFILNAQKEEVLVEFPFIQDWIDNVESNFLKKEIDDSKLSFFYSYGFFLPKIENPEEFYSNMYDKTSKMLFDERLTFELSKVRVNLTMKVGKNFILSDRLVKGSLPSVVKLIVTELTKVKMILESDFNESENSEEIKKSIPDVDRTVVDFEIIRDVIEKDYDIKNFDIDNLLDKINEDGIESLSDEERDFLDKKSKDI